MTKAEALVQLRSRYEHLKLTIEVSTGGLGCYCEVGRDSVVLGNGIAANWSSAVAACVNAVDLALLQERESTLEEAAATWLRGRGWKVEK